jgi:ABC-type nickel/cobalt efflux system permease component RcnA
VAFLKYRTSSVIVGVLIILALLGIYSAITTNPSSLLRNMAIIALIGIGIYFVVRKISNSSPQRKEQQAFLKAAKKSKKRLHHKSGDPGVKTSSVGPLSTLKKSSKTKKKSPAHLTVIDGKKGKKKNRASF